MPTPDDRDAGRLWEMRRAAADALEMAEGLTLELLRSDKRSRYAIGKAIEIVGEEAAKLSAGFTAAHPEIPWVDVVGLRHRLVHDYRRIRWERVWEVLQRDLPALIAWIDPILALAADDDRRESGSDNEG